MSPVTFICRATLPQTPQEIGAQILDLSQWPKFQGYGPLPGIRSAEFEVRTSEGVGTRIRVVNTDGSTHVEEFTEWRPDRRIQLRMDGFSPPLSRLATHIVETWQFTDSPGSTAVTRSFEMHAKSRWTKPAVWLIARLLKLAVQHHLRDLRRAGAS